MKNFVSLISAVWMIYGGMSMSVRADNGPVGLDAMEQLERISEIRQGPRAGQAGSYQRNNRNHDYSGFLAVNGSEKTMLDVEGPGCIYRIWMTFDPQTTSGNIRIYLDGSMVPTVDMNLGTFFNGYTAPFLSPLCGNSFSSSGGYYCYVPIPFREGCRIITTSPADRIYYNITYHRYPTAEGVSTFTGNESTLTMQNRWNNCGTDYKADTGTMVVSGTTTVPAGGFVDIAELSGAGVIQSLDFTTPEIDDALAYELGLQMYWDGQSPPAVDVPFGPFFGAGLYHSSFNIRAKGYAFGQDDVTNRSYCFFPMPYKTGAVVRLTNARSTDISGISYTIGYTPLTQPQLGVGRFHSQYNYDPHPDRHQDYVFLDEDGAGHLVGIVQTLRGYSDSQWYLEGDEHFYIDGSRTPALIGSGTEDFYNGGWYFQNGYFNRPVHGNAMNKWEGDSADTCYRQFLSDCIPWTHRIVAGIEHGGWNEYDVAIDSVVMYYKIDEPLSRETDFIDVGNVAYTQAPWNYSATNITFSGSKTSYYDVHDTDLPQETYNGVHLGAGGTSSFSVAIDKKNNGVLLRRRINYGYPNQMASVTIDGQPAGIWYEPGSNAHDGTVIADYFMWRDSEFLVPPDLTRGKERITVQLTNLSATSPWTEYDFRVVSMLPIEAVQRTGDFDLDDDVDMNDFAELQRCLAGSGQTIPAGCEAMDLDGDQDVDIYDAARFGACATAADVPLDANCMHAPIETIRPDVAGRPYPADQSTDISLDSMLGWSVGTGATSHNLYFGTTNPPPLIGNVTGNYYQPTLDYDSTYFWRVDEVNASGVTTGPTWQFSTLLKSLVSSLTPTAYDTVNLQVGNEYYVDRDYIITSLPPVLNGQLAIRTRNEDKNVTSTIWINFELARNSDVYIGYDNRGTPYDGGTLPAWLSGSFTDTGLSIGVTDSASLLRLYKKAYAAGPVTLGGNMASPAGGAGSNYIVLIVPNGS